MPIKPVSHFTQPARNMQWTKKSNGGTLISTNQNYFQLQDFFDELPDPGYYPSSIKSACFRRSANGNRMLQVVHALDDVKSAYQLVVDYFVLEGETVSPSGIFLARRRLVQLYRPIERLRGAATWSTPPTS